MKFTSILLALTLAVAACSSSQPDSGPTAENYPNLVQLRPPGTQKFVSSKVYIDSVNMISRGEQKALLISGNFPDGCTRLQNAGHNIDNDSLIISLTAWKPSDKMCTQAMVPFSFIYENVSKDQMQALPALSINKKNFKIQ